jgi:hypothetical protein
VAQRRPGFQRHSLSRNYKFVGKFNRRFHTASHITIFTGNRTRMS